MQRAVKRIFINTEIIFSLIFARYIFKVISLPLLSIYTGGTDQRLSRLVYFSISFHFIINLHISQTFLQKKRFFFKHEKTLFSSSLNRFYLSPQSFEMTINIKSIYLKNVILANVETIRFICLP